MFSGLCGESWERAEPSQPLPSIANRVESLLVQELALLKGLHKHKVEKSCLLEGVREAKGTGCPCRRRHYCVGFSCSSLDPLWEWLT